MDLLLSFAIQLFIVVDPIAGLPVFLAITPRNSAQERQAMARRGCLVAFLLVVFFLLGGPILLAYLGISTAAVQIAGGLLLFAIALEMLYGRPTGTGTTRREERLAEAKADISITPLAIPLLAGPGAIANCLIFAGRAAGGGDYLQLLAAAAAVFVVTYLLLARANLLAGWLGRLGTAITTRVMGLILAFLAVQYVIDGLHAALEG
ncbi:MarC family protein [Desulfuromonas carbonis]|uniref:MarC family protein n=1 Tax=Desulfuromonas sp. DDH964 TaxID=1823759 RepID=UPI00078CAD5F|nr:MarC family protein [Desulfuromonas sp. DDH964]AMV71937.1 MarC family membrane protein [Desulfuromonas sp. DDH964]